LIKEVVSSAFRCDRGDLVCRNRRNNDARKVGIYLARELSGKSLQEIGAAFGGIKEAMVCHTAAEITKRMAEDKRFSKRIEELIETVHEN
jgi:chromosomal replication initiator protein